VSLPCSLQQLPKKWEQIGYCIYSRSTIGTSCRIRSRKIFYTPNGVSLEIEEVHAMGVQINIDNLSILEQFG
jgi:hypothetical protein